MKKVLFLLLSIFTILSCPVPDRSEPRDKVTGTGLKISFNASSVPNRTIVPGIVMTVATYDITGNGPGGATFSRTGVAAGSAVQVTGLAVGTWTIHVDAKNASGVIIANGDQTANVSSGVVSNVTVTVTPLVGNGTLQTNVTCVNFTSPTVSGTVTNSTGSVTTLTFTGTGNTKNSTQTLAKGYYTLALTVSDGIQTGYFIDSVRIVYNETTTANLTVTGGGGTGQGLNISVVEDMQNPIQITFAGNLNQLDEGHTMTVTATTSPSPVDSYQWYLDGVAISGATNASVTVGAGLAVKNGYRLTLIVKLGTIISSESVTFDVQPATPVDPDMVDNFNDGDDTNLWSGPMGPMPDETITKSYDTDVYHGTSGSSLKLVYDISATNSWNGFWIKLAAQDTTDPDNPIDQPKDLSTYKYLSFWIKGAVGGTEHMKISLANLSTNLARKTAYLYINDYLDGGITDDWQEVKIPLDGFANLDGKINCSELCFVFENAYAANSGFATTGTVYIDDLKFFTTSLGYVRVDHFGDNWGLNALCGNKGDMNNSSTVFETTGHNYARSMRSNYALASGEWCGWFMLFGGGADGWAAQECNFSAYTSLTMWVKANSDAENPTRIKIEIKHGAGSTTNVNLTGITTSWQKYTINLATVGVDKTKIKQINGIYEYAVAVDKSGALIFDEIQFE